MGDVMQSGSKPTQYRGIIKHKQWQPGGGFGTLCPDWTHRAEGRGFAGDPFNHRWQSTIAHELFEEGVDDAQGHRYAARRGIAFKAQPSNDGTWHGYPLPWHDVPPDIQDILIEKGQATRRDIRRQKAADTDGIKWALKSDEQ